MKDILYDLFFTHYTQTLVLSVLVMAFPLEKKKGWEYKYAAFGLIAFTIGAVFEQYRLFSMNSFVPATIVIYLMPVALSFLTLYVTFDISVQEILYCISIAYLGQHMGNSITTMIFGYNLGVPDYTIPEYIGRWVITFGSIIAVYHLIGKKLTFDGHYRVSLQKSVVTFLLVLVVVMGLNIIYKFSEHISTASYTTGLIYDFFSCLFLLMIQLGQQREQELWAQIEIEKSLRQRALEQYEKTRSNVEMINQKCHDIKHSIAALRLEKDRDLLESGLKEMEQAVDSYDVLARTGNEVLDTLLSEKGFICEQRGIEWTCMADGKLLNFISTVDLFTMLGNALDNAIESTLKLDDTEKKVVSVVVKESLGMAMIQIENYYDDLLTNGEEFLTTKDDKFLHGFGIKSIKRVVESYNGAVDISTDDNLFIMTILIPLPVTDK